MEDLFKHLETLGVSMADSRAATDYGKANTQDELHYCAGEHLALHAVSITMALHLPRRGSAVLALMKRVARSRWERYWKLQNDAFCLSALLDLCTVRSVFREQKRWPELSSLLDHVFVMCCVYRTRAIEMAPDEKDRFLAQVTNHLVDFQDDGSRKPEQQIDRLMNLDGIHRDRLDKAAFVRSAIVERSWLDPWALIHHHDRIAAAL
jgi:hypothetical protein